MNKRQFLRTAVLSTVLSVPYAMAEKILLNDFQKAEFEPWEFVTDQVMGGVSTGSASIETDSEQRYLHLKGLVSTENNGGFIQTRRSVPAESVRGVSGVYVIVKGNGEEYFIHLRSKWTVLPWQYYQAAFSASGEWQEIRMPLGEFKASGWMLPRKISPTDIRSIGIVAFGRDYSADVSIKEAGFYKD